MSSSPIDVGVVDAWVGNVAMATSLLCHHKDYCGKPAVHVCAGCGWHYCGEHVLRASFSQLGVVTSVVVDACHECLPHIIQQQHAQGRTLSHWRKAGHDDTPDA